MSHHPQDLAQLQCTYDVILEANRGTQSDLPVLHVAVPCTASNSCGMLRGGSGTWLDPLDCEAQHALLGPALPL